MCQRLLVASLDILLLETAYPLKIERLETIRLALLVGREVLGYRLKTNAVVTDTHDDDSARLAFAQGVNLLREMDANLGHRVVRRGCFGVVDKTLLLLVDDDGLVGTNSDAVVAS